MIKRFFLELLITSLLINYGCVFIGHNKKSELPIHKIEQINKMGLNDYLLKPKQK